MPPSVISPEQSASLMTIRGSSVTGRDTDKWVWLVHGVIPDCGRGLGSDHFLTTCNTLLSLTIFLLRMGRWTRVSITWGEGGGERGGEREEGRGRRGEGGGEREGERGRGGGGNWCWY